MFINLRTKPCIKIFKYIVNKWGNKTAFKKYSTQRCCMGNTTQNLKI